MKKLVSLLLSALMLLTLAACGGQASDPKSIVIWHDKEDAVAEVVQSYLSEALPDYTITLEKKTSLTDSLKLVGNDPSSAPDMFIFAHDKIGLFAEMGILAPVEELLPEGELESYLPMTTEAASYKGTVYQLPLYFETLLFMYNSKYMTDEMAPETTEELYAYMEANTGRDRYGFVEQHSTAYYSAAWIHGFGGEIISADGVPFPEPQAVKDALEYHLKFVQLMPGETEYSTVNTLFLEGKADSTIGGPWMVPSAREAGIELGHSAHAGGGRDGPAARALFRRAGRARAHPRGGEQGRGRARRPGGAHRARGRRGARARERLRPGEGGVLRRRGGRERRARAGHAHNGRDRRPHAQHPRDGRDVDRDKQPAHGRQPLRPRCGREL